MTFHMRLWGASVLVLALALTATALAASSGSLSGRYGRTVTGSGKALDGHWVLNFKSAGRYTVTYMNHAVGNALIAIKGNKATLHDTACTSGPQLGTYTYRLSGATLTFTRITDACHGRSVVLSKPLYHVP